VTTPAPDTTGTSDSTGFPFGETEATALVDSLGASWDVATNNTPPQRCGLVIGGVPVVFEWTDPQIFHQLHRALAHHRRFDPGTRPPTPTPSGPVPDATPPASPPVVRLWSLDAAGSRHPTLPPTLVQHASRRFVRPDGSEVRARFDPDNRVLMAWDSGRPTAWWCIESTHRLQWWEEAAPLRPVLSWILPHHGRHFAHGAAVGNANGAIMLVGPGGSGKSTTALACHLAGMDYLGDDYCLVTEAGGQPTVHSLYGTAKVRINDDLAAGVLAPHLLRATPPTGGKAVAVVAERSGANVVHEAPVAVVAAVTVGQHRRTHIADARAVEVLAALAPNSLQQLPGATPATFAALADLVRSVPVCRITLGHDRDGVTEAVASVLADPMAWRP